MFDTWAKIQSGVLVGNRFNFGHFTECLRFYFKSGSDDVGEIVGQHCMVSYEASLNVTLEGNSNEFDWREM